MAKTQRRQLLSVPSAAQLFHMLGDENRLRILLFLSQRKEMNVSALGLALGQSQPATSHHLTLLRATGLVSYRREGKHNFYFLTSDFVRQLLLKIKF
jgi:DNA-binding transcriptional ArsR family regulator